MIRFNLAVFIISFLMTAIILGGVVFAQTATPTETPTVIPTMTPSPTPTGVQPGVGGSGTVPYQAPNAGMGGAADE